VVLSRADASPIVAGIAAALGMAKEELAIKLSEAEQAKTDADRDAEAQRLMRELFGPAGAQP
jgi:protein-disulfide isomerase-like protein with CxxC motif